MEVNDHYEETKLRIEAEGLSVNALANRAKKAARMCEQNVHSKIGKMGVVCIEEMQRRLCGVAINAYRAMDGEKK